MTILDSNTIIYLSKELIHVDDVFIDDEEYGISIITYMEVLGFAFATIEEENFINKLFGILKIIYINEKIAAKVIAMRKEYQIKLPDAIICASAILADGYLITNDIRLKNIKELKLKLLKV